MLLFSWHKSHLARSRPAPFISRRSLSEQPDEGNQRQPRFIGKMVVKQCVCMCVARQNVKHSRSATPLPYQRHWNLPTPGTISLGWTPSPHGGQPDTDPNCLWSAVLASQALQGRCQSDSKKWSLDSKSLSKAPLDRVHVSVCHHLTRRVTGCVSLPSPHSKSHGLPCWRGNGQPANIRPPTSLAWHGRATDKQSLHFQNLAVRSSMKQFIIHVCVSYHIKHQKHIFSKTSFNQPAKLPLACQRANNLLIFLSFIFFNPPLGDQLSQNMLNWSLPNFQIDTQMGEHDQSNLLFAIAQETLLW